MSNRDYRWTLVRVLNNPRFDMGTRKRAGRKLYGLYMKAGELLYAHVVLRQMLVL